MLINPTTYYPYNDTKKLRLSPNENKQFGHTVCTEMSASLYAQTLCCTTCTLQHPATQRNPANYSIHTQFNTDLLTYCGLHCVDTG